MIIMVLHEPDFLNFQKQLNMEKVGAYGFPRVKGVRLKHPDDTRLIGFNYATNPKTRDKDKQWVHFFLPDYRFQQVWNQPTKYIECFKQYKGICSPDFSCYIGMPKAMQIFNVYRMAFLSAYYEQNGIKVLPSVTWGEPDTYSWCFDWVPKGSAVVVSTVGCMQNKKATVEFLKGYEKMLEVVNPYQVILYGHVSKDVEEMYPTYTRVPDLMELRKSTALWQQPKNWDMIMQEDTRPKRLEVKK